MALNIKNDFGTISIDNDVIARVAGQAAMDCYGIVGMAVKSVRDGVVTLLKKESLTKGIQIKINENNITLDLHIIVEYGTNISAIANSLMENVKYHVEKHVGLCVESVNIFIQGMRV